LINLGVTHNALGNRARALEYYTRSYELAERRGDERRAAYSRANAGALLIEYGSTPDDGVRFVEGALRVVRRLEDKNFEVFCLQLVAARDRFSGRWAEARKGLAQALAIARERSLGDLLPSLLLDDARVLIEMGEYAQARDALSKAMAEGGASTATDPLIELGRLRTRLGEFDGAREALEQAKATTGAKASDVVPRLMAAFGELAYVSNRAKEARAPFETASRLWTDDLPDAASVEARAYLGFLDGLEGRAAGRAAIEASLRQAARMKRPVVQAVCRLLQARLELRARRPAQALTALGPIPIEVLSPELRAQVHWSRAEAQMMLGDSGDAERERREVGHQLDDAGRAVPMELRERYLSRPDLQALASLRQ
jgi:tetratricopeptide (TPR) repeat protein